ncbi:AAA family ATPase [Pseudomonas viridiflava]|uniref:AAA family ATPase n=1 Tax=Pseudomonas viridiflava TaxID=33069 RepID=UPI000F02E6D6|nr:AAA family ATPase [Pseudomonas viridiflava]
MLEIFRAATKDFEADIVFVPNPELKNNTWTTVLIGKNGSRKSFLLRLILETAFGKTQFTYNKKEKIKTQGFGWTFHNRPQKIICISGTPLDRFPRTGSTSWTSTKKKNNRQFLYLGQRASNGMVGTAQSERSLITTIIENAENLFQKKHLFEKVFNYLELAPKIKIKLKPSKALSDAFSVLEKAKSQHSYMASDALEDLASKLVNSFTSSYTETHLDARTLAALNKISKTEHYGIFKLRNIFSTTNDALGLVFETGSVHKYGPNWENWDTDEWIFFLRAGFLDVDHTVFYRKENSEQSDSSPQPFEPYDILGEHLSSGQWSWLAGFVGLCAEIKNNSLILVDEPENSLHPIWQQNYIPMLQSIAREFPGTQTIIATHSPLIASGINPEHGNVLALKSNLDRKTNQTYLTATHVENTFGWAASDVYQEAFGVTSDRAPPFTATADIALSIIRKNEALGANESSLIIEDLAKKLESLPLHDPLRNVLQSIVAKLQSITKGNP